MSDIYLNQTQFKAEIEKCLHCPSKPCEKACPAGVSPYDFINAALEGDFQKAGKLILQKNSLAEICGLICPDKFCQKACLRAKIDCAINIPKVQAYIMKKYREYNFAENPSDAPKSQRLAIIGSGPAGISASSVLLKAGYMVEVFEKSSILGGTLNMIPDIRLPKEIINAEWLNLVQHFPLIINTNHEIINPRSLLAQGFSGVIVAIGENKYRKLDIEGEILTINYNEYLLNPEKYKEFNNVAVVGGGAAAVDCTTTAHLNGAKKIEMFVRRRICDMRITAAERELLLKNQIDITSMTRVTKIARDADKLVVYTCKTQFDDEGKLKDIPNTEIARKGFDLIVLALGSKAENLPKPADNIIFAGDCINGSSTAVQAVASGNKAANKLLDYLKSQDPAL